ncbi:prepilin peptidase [Fontivita pretiosa]|uniref:prepilin peptidase n=1 Tax=Fontivita pretiosa TaxID=2989684 RepID=UPI003D170233
MPVTRLSHLPFILFVLALGACVGSFLNVVVWRLPRGQSIVSPPSHCPACGTRLAWRDNIPIVGWIILRGRCRYCAGPISPRYPIVEAITALLFVVYYVAMFVYQEGPCPILRPLHIASDWPMYGLYMTLLAALLACSLIDAELFIIPIEIPWLVGGVAMLVHALVDSPTTPGALLASAPVGAMSAGCGLGLVLSIVLLRRGILEQSFAEGAPLLEIEKERIQQQARNQAATPASQPDADVPMMDFTPAQIRREMRKEMLFLIPPLLLGGVCLLLWWKLPPVTRVWNGLMGYHWLSGLLGSLWGGLVGAFAIWLTRILGSFVFGREAMGMGDVHLMFGIGAVIGAFGSVIVYFLAPFFGLLFALHKLFFRKGRELPYGPFLSMASAVVMLFYCRIYTYLHPQFSELAMLLRARWGI